MIRTPESGHQCPWVLTFVNDAAATGQNVGTGPLISNACALTLFGRTVDIKSAHPFFKKREPI